MDKGQVTPQYNNDSILGMLQIFIIQSLAAVGLGEGMQQYNQLNQ